MPSPLTGTGDDRDDAPQGAREAGVVEQGVNFPLRRLGVALQAGMPQVKIDNDVMGCRYFRDQGTIVCAASASWENSECVAKMWTCLPFSSYSAET